MSRLPAPGSPIIQREVSHISAVLPHAPIQRPAANAFGAAFDKADIFFSAYLARGRLRTSSLPSVASFSPFSIPSTPRPRPCADGWNATLAFCCADSDGDNQTNGHELGDAYCIWQVGMVRVDGCRCSSDETGVFLRCDAQPQVMQRSHTTLLRPATSPPHLHAVSPVSLTHFVPPAVSHSANTYPPNRRSPTTGRTSRTRAWRRPPPPASCRPGPLPGAATRRRCEDSQLAFTSAPPYRGG